MACFLSFTEAVVGVLVAARAENMDLSALHEKVQLQLYLPTPPSMNPKLLVNL
jgi:hypothetical protein